jgi:hypothetical protein
LLPMHTHSYHVQNMNNTMVRVQLRNTSQH